MALFWRRMAHHSSSKLITELIITEFQEPDNTLRELLQIAFLTMLLHIYGLDQ